MPHDIRSYWRDLNDLRRVAGADNEGTLSQAFAAPKRQGAPARWCAGWEAKDSKDDLGREIAPRDLDYPRPFQRSPPPITRKR